MLRKHVEAAGAKRFAIAAAFLDRIKRRLCFQIFEPIAGDEQCPGRYVESVIGAADTLQKPRRTFGRPHLNHTVDIAPINPEV